MLQQNEIDQIKEVINIGTGQAFKSLGELLNKIVMMKAPEPHIDSIEKVQQSLGNSEELVMAIYLQFNGDISGSFLMTLPNQSAIELSKRLNPEAPQEQSTLTEVGNILIGSAANAFSQFLDFQLQHSVPDFTSDMKGAIIDAVLLQTSTNHNQSIGVRVELIVEDAPINGDIYYFFDENSSQKILSKTKKILENNG